MAADEPAAISPVSELSRHELWYKKRGLYFIFAIPAIVDAFMKGNVCYDK